MSHAEPIRPAELFLHVNITSRCNLSCTHCYVDSGSPDDKSDFWIDSGSDSGGCGGCGG